jgi:hypothetical protein
VAALYGPVNDGEMITRIEPFQYSSSARSQPVDGGVAGQVIALRSGRELTSVQDILYIDRGAEHGLKLGDILRISSPASAGPVREQAEAMVVHTDPRTATLVVLQVSQPDIRNGATARQTRRMPS